MQKSTLLATIQKEGHLRDGEIHGLCRVLALR
jgi:hypothetical protein